MTRRYGLLPCVCGAFSSPFCVTERCLDGRTYWCRKNRFLLHSSKYSFGTGLLPLAVFVRTQIICGWRAQYIDSSFISYRTEPACIRLSLPQLPLLIQVCRFFENSSLVRLRLPMLKSISTLISFFNLSSAFIWTSCSHFPTAEFNVASSLSNSFPFKR
uniref:Uncharacterized protein n=1 Tax=Ixodes ricinus TaxID=34613 RepID=A0A6B0UWA5_IXORI